MHWRRAAGVVLVLVGTAALVASHGVFEKGRPHPPRLNDADIVASVSRDLVEIVASAGTGTPRVEGTGIVVTPSGVVLTNNHVIDGATVIRVADHAERRTYDASVLGYDADADVAVLKLHGGSSLPSADLGRFARAERADGGDVVAVAAGRKSATGRVTGRDASIVEYSELTGATQDLSGLLATSASVGPGFSGGPLLDDASRIVGMDVAYAPGEATANGYAIPSSLVRRVARIVLSGRGTAEVHVGPTAGLGVRITPVASIGAVVVEVPAGSALATAGLHAGDVVDAVTGTEVSSPTALSAVLQLYEPGDKVSVGWLTPRGERSSSVVRLVAGPPG